MKTSGRSAGSQSPPIYFFVEGEDTSTEAVAKELRSHPGLVASKKLRKALRDERFLKFAEFCAGAAKAHPVNLWKMAAGVFPGRGGSG